MFGVSGAGDTAARRGVIRSALTAAGSATWNRDGRSESNPGFIDTSFERGEILADWLDVLGASTDYAEIEIQSWRRTLVEVDEPVQRYLYNDDVPGDDVDSTQNVRIDTPVGADRGNECGRFVFSDMHVSAEDSSSSSTRFPEGCNTDELLPQEKALVYMMFELAACIEPPPIE